MLTHYLTRIQKDSEIGNYSTFFLKKEHPLFTWCQGGILVFVTTAIDPNKISTPNPYSFPYTQFQFFSMR